MCIVSVVLMTYNSEAFLTETLNSIFSQTLKDIEVIVMDDNSTDNTLKLYKFHLMEIGIFIIKLNVM